MSLAARGRPLAKNLYAVLGVDKKASDAAIKTAYRQLAKSCHPDLHPGDPAAEARFRELTGAYDLLGDPDKRAKYDRGEIDAAGAERRTQADYRHYADTRAGRSYYSTGAAGDFEDMSDIMSEMFRQRQAGTRGHVRMRGSDVRYNLTIAFLEAIDGSKQRVTMPDGGTLDISIPKGVRDGQVLRLKGKGLRGLGGGPPGDALISVSVAPHPVTQAAHAMRRRESGPAATDESSATIRSGRAPLQQPGARTPRPPCRRGRE